MFVILIKLGYYLEGCWYSMIVVVVELIKSNGLEWKRFFDEGGKAIYLYLIPREGLYTVKYPPIIEHASSN